MSLIQDSNKVPSAIKIAKRKITYDNDPRISIFAKIMNEEEEIFRPSLDSIKEAKKNERGGIIIPGIFIKALPPSKDPKAVSRGFEALIFTINIESLKDFINKNVLKLPAKNNVKSSNSVGKDFIIEAGKTYIFSGPIEKIEKLEPGDWIEMHRIEPCYYEDKDKKIKISINCKPHCDKFNGKAMIYDILVNNLVINSYIRPWTMTIEDLNRLETKNIYPPRKIVIIRLDNIPELIIPILDPQLHSHISVVHSMKIEEKPENFYWKDAKQQEYIKLKFALKIRQSPIGTKEDIFVNVPKNTDWLKVFVTGFEDSVKIFGIDDVNIWKSMIYTIMSTGLEMFLICDINYKDTTNNIKQFPNSRAMSLLFAYADMRKHYTEIGFPITETYVPFVNTGETITSKVDVIRMHDKSPYHTAALKTMKNVSYRVISNFTINIITKMRKTFETMKPEQGNEIFKILSNWNQYRLRYTDRTHTDSNSFVDNFIIDVFNGMKDNLIMVIFAIVPKDESNSDYVNVYNEISKQFDRIGLNIQYSDEPILAIESKQENPTNESATVPLLTLNPNNDDKENNDEEEEYRFKLQQEQEEEEREREAKILQDAMVKEQIRKEKHRQRSHKG